MSWHEIVLGDAIQIKHGFAFKSQYFSDSGDFIVLTPGNFFESGGFRLRPNKERYYIGDVPQDYVLNENDVIVAMTEQGPGLLGSSAWVPEAGKYLHNQRLGLVQIEDEKLLNKGFLYFLFNTRTVRGQINGSASGTKVRHTSPKRICSVKVNIPCSVVTQSKIAETLFAYDDLIENNRRRIQLLEESARLLYKEWFVHLRFPGHEHVKVVDGVPEGWKIIPFSKLATFINGYAFKPSDLGDSGLPIVKIPELRDGILPKTPRNSGEMVDEKYHLETGDLLFSWSGTLLVNLWSSGHALLNQHLFKVVSSEPETASRPFLHYSLKQMLEHFMNQTTGATMKHIRKSALDKVTALVPSKPLMKSFTDLAFELEEQIITLRNYTERLSQARDLLLPRLMNGEIKV